LIAARPLDQLRLLAIGLPARRLGALKADLGVGAVAIRLAAAVAAPAERILALWLERLAPLLADRLAVFIGADGHLGERQIVRHQVWTVFGDANFQQSLASGLKLPLRVPRLYA